MADVISIVPPSRRSAKHDDARKSVIHALISATFTSLTACFVYLAKRYAPESSFLTVCLTSAGINLVYLVGHAYVWGEARLLWGDRRLELWLRGVFGAVCLLTSYASIQMIGVGDASFLAATNGIFVTFLAPLVLRQRNSIFGWLAILGAFCGIFFLSHPRVTDISSFGRLVGLSTGILGAIAYLLITRASSTNSPRVTVFYFCLISFLLNLALCAVFRPVWPDNTRAFLMMVLAGLSTIGIQHFRALAYSRVKRRGDRADLVAAATYFSPVLSFILGVVLFNNGVDSREAFGAALILGCGVILPFLKAGSSYVAAPAKSATESREGELLTSRTYIPRRKSRSRAS